MAVSSQYAPRLLPLRLPRVCVALVGSDAAEMFAKADQVVRDNPFVEFRLDYLRQPGTAYPRLRRFFDYHPAALAIATCRRAVNGGKFRGTASAEADILVKAAGCGCQLMDLEVESATVLKPQELARLRSSGALILSAHDFRSTRKLEETFLRMSSIPADFYKAVTTANSLSDNVTVMKFLESNGDRYSLIALCMGEQGIISRVLGVRAGSVFTFAAAGEGEETAPGQISTRELRDIYRIEQVDAATRVYGVAGDPVQHSLSPAMMNAAFRRENVNAVYLRLHARKIGDLLACVRDIPLHGISVTMPYKQEILAALDNTDPLTAKVGACNTVIRTPDGKLYGYNTDVAGIVRPLEQRLRLAGAKVLVLGAGGAARAAAFGLKERGAEVFIINRSSANGQKLARQSKSKFLARTAIRKMQFDVILNATPVGMTSAKVSPLEEDELNARYLMELIYNPSETRLVKMARTKGLEVITGAEMFVQQGARQFEIWTGKPAPVDDMQRVVLAALQATPSLAVPAKKQ
jgi:3-dehydroquinate dehydratase/shikimate dehydrogenase